MAHPTINETILHVAEFHQGQVDELGAPYFFHPMRVMMRLGPGAPESEKHAALLHDAMEDNQEVTPGRLRELGYAEDVVVMDGLLTRQEDETYCEFIDRIIASGNMGAMRLKLADLYDNTDEGRLKDASAEVRGNLTRMAENRYRPAIAKIKLALGQEAEAIISGGLGGHEQFHAMVRDAKKQGV